MTNNTSVPELLNEVIKTETGQNQQDISKLIDKLRDKENAYDLSFLTKTEKEFLLELIVCKQLIFKNSTRIPELIMAYLNLSKSQDRQFIKTIADLYKNEVRQDTNIFNDIPKQLQRVRR